MILLYTLPINPLCDLWAVQDAGKAAGGLRWLLRTQAELCCHPWALHSSSALTRAHFWAPALLWGWVALQKFPSNISLFCNRAIPGLHTGAVEKRRGRALNTTPLTPLLLLWSWFLLFFQALTTLLVSQHLFSPTNAIPTQWAECRKKEAYAWASLYTKISLSSQI